MKGNGFEPCVIHYTEKIAAIVFEREYLFTKVRIGSVTRFGEISPLWQSFKSLGQIFEGFGKLIILLVIGC